VPPAPASKNPAARKSVLVLGRLTGGRWKAFEFFMTVLQRVGQGLPATTFKIAGRVPDEHRAALEKWIQETNKQIAPSSVESIGWTDRLPELIAASDAVVGAGRSALESLSLGKPVIMLGEGGVLGLANSESWPLALRTNLGDHIVPKAFYPAPLEVALRDLLTNDAKFKEWGRWGHDQVKTSYDIREVASAVEKVYHELRPAS
jgi:glycosyltransferase involved in cell wall biosynthesis